MTRESLMDTSLNLFLKKGYSQTTLDDIVKSINLTRGAFYGHFKDKEDLFEKVMTRELNFISELIANSFVSHSEEKVQLQQLLLNVIENFYTNRRFRKIIELTWFRIDVNINCNIMRDKTNLNEFLIEEIDKVLIRAHKNGKIGKETRTLDTAVAITALVTGIYRLYFVTPKYVRDKNTAKRIVTNYINLLFNNDSQKYFISSSTESLPI